jgi:hypothetical protein
MIKMIAFDLDGTAFDDHKVILPETKKAFSLAAERGVQIVPATGRPFTGLLSQVDRLEGVEYVVTSNGAGVYEKKTGMCLHEQGMKLETILPLMERLEELDVMADAFVKGDSFMSQPKQCLIDKMNVSDEIKQFIRSIRTVVPSQVDYLRERGDAVEKLTINFMNEPDGKRRDYEKAWEIIREYPELNAVCGGMHNIEVTARGISKASALQWLCQRLGIAPEETAAFGDSGNDVEMLKFAGVGVAMGNAGGDAKEAAQFVTKSNNENGIAYAIDYLKLI